MTRKVVNDMIFDKESCQREDIRRKGVSENMPLKNKLKDYRALLGVNQQEMGKLAGVSRQTISQIERGDYSPSVTLALKLAKLCNVTVEDIFEYEEDDNE